MKLYEVTNGYVGESYVKCLAIAENESKAVELAKVQYQEEADNMNEPKYCEKLQARLLCDDTSKEYTGYISD